TRTTRDGELRAGRRWLEGARQHLSTAEKEGRLDAAKAEFDQLRKSVGEPLSLDNVATLPEAFERRQRQHFDRLQESLQPVARELTGAMTRFLKKFPDEQSDLDAHVASLASFVALHQRIAGDDLPQHEERFKKRLNEKVLHEIGFLRSGLETECQEIRGKIEQLNTALKLLQWKPGTYMQLEPSDVQDREILDFRRDLAGCLSGTFDGTPEANEATFVRIEKLVEKLRDENNARWRDKVIDVRNWFSFAARELVAETGEVRSFYDGGTGQSGGEKGKLAFLVLVAAIAYQYDLEPDAESSDRFHFVMVDEMFSRSDDQHAEYALELFERFRLQLLIVAPLDAKARVTEPYVGTYLHVVKNKETHRSQLLSITAEELNQSIEQS
ncbi:MAG: SbcC/MukB-like Walker B domain-containing protein, partial [Aureliella sp.]